VNPWLQLLRFANASLWQAAFDTMVLGPSWIHSLQLMVMRDMIAQDPVGAVMKDLTLRILVSRMKIFILTLDTVSETWT
jgi:hypothetical protein